MLIGQLGRKAVAQVHGRNVLARVRPVAGRRQVAFKGSRPSVRVFSATPDAPATIKLADVKEGEEYEGTVTAVEEFGAFVNFGSSTNGLVHISKMGPGYTKAVKDVVSVGQKVTVKVLSVDAAKNRVSLELKSAAGEAAAAAGSPAGEVSLEDFGAEGVQVLEARADGGDEEGEGEAAEEEDEVEVELEEGQVEVYADLPGFDDIPFVVEEDEAEMTSEALAAMEADIDAVEIQYELEHPPYMEEVSGKVTRVEDYGIFLEFAWNGKTLTGLLSRDELKVPSSALSPEAQDALRAEWAGSGFEMPQFATLPDDELDVKRYYAVGDEVPAFVLESELISERGLSLTHFTEEDIAAEAVEAYEECDEGDDEELDRMLEDAAEALRDEVLAFEPEALLEQGEEDGAGGLGLGEDAAEYEGVNEEVLESAVVAHSLGATRSGLIKGKNGYQVAPLGLPSRPLLDADVNDFGLAQLNTRETDFDGDEVQLVDYFDGELYDRMPKDILKRMGLKLSYTEQGEAEFTEREGAGEGEGEDVTRFLLDGDLEGLARELAEELLEEDEEEAELPARAARRPLLL